MGLTQFDARCLVECTNKQVSTTGNEQSSEICLCIDLEETIVYASTLKAALRGYILTKWTRTNCRSFDNNWPSCTNLAEFDHPHVHLERVACW